MARVYQEAHLLENLASSVKALQQQANTLTAGKIATDDKLRSLSAANELMVKKNAELELRLAAWSVVSSTALRWINTDDSEHNAAARITNAHIGLSANPNHSTLVPLHDISTNRPIRQFPKHERDVRTLGQSQVIQILQALGIKTLGMGAADKKLACRVQIGLSQESAPPSGT